ncbi:MAG: MarR family transcriptional regulator [Candidatus Hodarchaeales archaeon]
MEYLFFEGTVNQQNIADSLGFSRMAVSRLITKLEKKELLFREPSGFNKMINLNYERL